MFAIAPLVLSSLVSVSLSLAPVVGGTVAPPGRWPDAVAVYAEDALCTGTLIAPDVVLTAGHCIDVHPRYVIVGRVDLSKPGGEFILVASARAYPDWEDRYDVGVLVLAWPSTAKPRAIAATCAARAGLVVGAPTTVVGFGLTTKSGTGNNNKLHQGTIPVVDARCQHDSACKPEISPDGEFTAGGHGVDACFGDSGGPVYLDTPKGTALVGIVSRGDTVAGVPCGNGGVYVRADKVATWIESVTHRKLTRTGCGGAADGEDDPDPEPEPDDAGGCSAGGTGGLALASLALLGVVARRRR